MRRRLWGLAGWLVLLSFAGGWYAFLRPPALGGPTSYVIVRGTSMLPSLRSGDLVIVRRASTYRPGQVVALPVAVPGGTARNIIIHRIIERQGENYVLQGDNVATEDPWRPAPADILGREVARFPRFGLLMNVLAEPPILGGLAGLIAATSVLLQPRRSKRLRPERSPREPSFGPSV